MSGNDWLHIPMLNQASMRSVLMKTFYFTRGSYCVKLRAGCLFF